METIKQNEYSVLTFFLSRCLYSGITIHNILYYARQDSWISLIIAFIINIIPMVLFIAFLNLEPSLSFPQLIKKYFGKTFGTIMNIFLILSVLFHTSIVLWNLSNFINSQFLFKTPVLVIELFFMIPVVYTINKGIKVIGKTSMVLFLMSILIYVITFFSLIGKIELSNIFPMFENGFKPILNGSLMQLSYSVLSIFPLLIIPKNNINENNKLTKSLFKFYILSSITMFLVIFFIITILGGPLANLYEYPEFHILRTINIANFFQRIESILSFQWLFDLAIGLIVFIYYMKTALQQTFNFENKLNKTLILIISIVVIFISSIIFKNDTMAYEFLGNTYKYIRLVVLFLLPLIIYIIIRLKKKTN